MDRATRAKEAEIICHFLRQLQAMVKERSDPKVKIDAQSSMERVLLSGPWLMDVPGMAQFIVETSELASSFQRAMNNNAQSSPLLLVNASPGLQTP